MSLALKPMFILTLKNLPAALDYQVWNMGDIAPRLLLGGKLTGIGEAWGRHTYWYGFGSGKGASRSAGFTEAVDKITDIIGLAAQAYNRVEGIAIPIDAVGYLLREKPAGIEENTVVTPAFIEMLEDASSSEEGAEDIASDVRLIRAASERFPAAHHAALYDEVLFKSVPSEIKLYPIPGHLSVQGKINRFTHGATRLRSILEGARVSLRHLPRRIIVCDIDEITQVTAIKGDAIVGSTHEYGGLSSIFSSDNCGAMNPAAIRALASKTGMPCEEVITWLTAQSGVKNFAEGFETMRQLVDSLRLGRTSPLVQMFINHIVYSVAGLVALLGGIELLIISGDIGVDFPVLRSLLIKRLPILRLSIEEVQNDAEIRDIAEISARDAKVRILVVRPGTDRQIAAETQAMLESARM
jgi:acetate kinase